MINPNDTGKKDKWGNCCAEYSMEGKRRDQIEADNMIPPDKPNVILFTVLDGLLKKKTKREPTVVERHGNIKHSREIVVWFIVFF